MSFKRPHRFRRFADWVEEAHQGETDLFPGLEEEMRHDLAKGLAVGEPISSIEAKEISGTKVDFGTNFVEYLKRKPVLRGAGTILDLGAGHVVLKAYPRQRMANYVEVSSDLNAIWDDVGDCLKIALGSTKIGRSKR
jgi:hypothetical protein